MKPLILEQRKRGEDQGNSEIYKVAKTMLKYIQCIQSPEWAAATAHKITQEIPPGLIHTLETTRLCVVHACFIYPTVVCSWKALRRWQRWSYVCHLERHGLKIQTKRSGFCFYLLQILLLPLSKCQRKLLLPDCSQAGGCTGPRGDLPVQTEAAVSAFCYWEHTDHQSAEQPRASETDRHASEAHFGPVRAQQRGTALQRDRRSDLSWWANSITAVRINIPR